MTALASTRPLRAVLSTSVVTALPPVWLTAETAPSYRLPPLTTMSAVPLLYQSTIRWVMASLFSSVSVNQVCKVTSSPCNSAAASAPCKKPVAYRTMPGTSRVPMKPRAVYPSVTTA